MSGYGGPPAFGPSDPYGQAYGQHAQPPMGAVRVPVAMPRQRPALGIVALVTGLIATLLGSVVGIRLGRLLGPMTDDQATVDRAIDAELSQGATMPVILLCMGLGVGALVLGSVAIATRRGVWQGWSAVGVALMWGGVAFVAYLLAYILTGL